MSISYNIVFCIDPIYTIVMFKGKLAGCTKTSGKIITIKNTWTGAIVPNPGFYKRLQKDISAEDHEAIQRGTSFSHFIVG
ncbi:hypothetical protein HQ585_17740 [candidate division KSB1 bacterium]|nr:hypothetical protein [candidate division KSB1 bacterium]